MLDAPVLLVESLYQLVLWLPSSAWPSWFTGTNELG